MEILKGTKFRIIRSKFRLITNFEKKTKFDVVGQIKFVKFEILKKNKICIYFGKF